MSQHGKSFTARKGKELAERLARVASVSQFDVAGEPQGGTIAHAMSDIEDSCSIVLHDLLPKLLDEQRPPEELEEVLLDIGEELRHLLYHIRDTRYFGYLFADSDGGSKGQKGAEESQS